MSEHEAAAAHGSSSDGLWRWLVGGLVAGGILLGLLIAAYAIGYHRGQDAAGPSAAPTTTAAAPPTTTSPPPKPNAGSIGPVTVTPALVARGKTLYTSDTCSGCHSLNGSPGAGPSFKGLAGGTTTLATGQTLTADDAYLERSITNPDAQVVKGYHAGIMGPAIAGHDLAAHPADVRALVAFIKSQK